VHVINVFYPVKSLPQRKKKTKGGFRLRTKRRKKRKKNGGGLNLALSSWGGREKHRFFVRGGKRKEREKKASPSHLVGLCRKEEGDRPMPCPDFFKNRRRKGPLSIILAGQGGTK